MKYKKTNYPKIPRNFKRHIVRPKVNTRPSLKHNDSVVNETNASIALSKQYPMNLSVNYSGNIFSQLYWALGYHFLQRCDHLKKEIDKCRACSVNKNNFDHVIQGNLLSPHVKGLELELSDQRSLKWNLLLTPWNVWLSSL